MANLFCVLSYVSVILFYPCTSSNIVLEHFTSTDQNVYSYAKEIVVFNRCSLLSCALMSSRESSCVGFYYHGNVNQSCRLGSDLVKTPTVATNSELSSMYRILSQALPDDAKLCPAESGYKLVSVNDRTFCLKGDNSYRRFWDASDRCGQMGATLLYLDGMVNHLSELETILTQAGIYYSSFWVGAYQTAEGSPWRWSYTRLEMTPAEYDSIPWDVELSGLTYYMTLTPSQSDKARQEPCSNHYQAVCEVVLV